MKKIISILLALMLLMGIFAGCSANPEAQESAAPESAAPESVSPEAKTTYDYDAAYAAYEPDYVVATVNGIDVTWGEYFYWIKNIMEQVCAYVGTVDNFNEDFGGMSYAEYFKAAAENNCRQYRAVEYHTAKEGIELSQEALDALAIQLENDIAAVSPDGTEEGLNEYLASLYTTREVYDYVNRISALYSEAAVHYCGANAEKVTDAEAMEFAEMSGLMAAKHILLKTVNDDNTHYTEDEKQKQYDLALELIDRLNAGESMDELIKEYGQDPGAQAYPLGYCFGPNEMVAEFENAVKELSVGQITQEPVESSYGYHIIMKVAFDPEMVYTQQGTTIRQMAATNKFNSVINEWFIASPIEYTEGFELNFEEVFKKVEA